MKFKAKRGVMAEALQMALPIVPARSPKPVLQNLCLIAEGELLRILATDLELGIWCDVKDVSIEEPGKAAMPARELSAIVRSMPDDEISLESSANQCVVRGSDSDYRLMGEDPGDYPEVPDFEGDPTFLVSRQDFFRMIDLTAFCAARERRRYALNGVHMSVKGSTLELTATDMKRLGIVKKKIKGKVGERKLILPTRALTHLTRMARPEEESIDVLISDNMVLFRTKQGVLCSRQIEGQFPPCESVIPSGYEIKVELPREAFEVAVERASILSNEDARSVRLSFEKGKLTLSSQSSDLGSARVEMPVKYSWDPLEIGFNPVFLIEVLKRLATDAVTLELKESTLPGVIKGEPDYTYVVMPLTLV